VESLILHWLPHGKSQCLSNGRELKYSDCERRRVWEDETEEETYAKELRNREERLAEGESAGNI